MVGVLRSFDFPIDSYTDDVQSIAEATIRRFGAREWKLVLLTNEIHGHLGIYSTLGAKMGLCAEELLGDSEGSLSVLSYAGFRPPVSCLNDGLQISTGATLGHGLIRVSDEKARPEAAFTKDGKTILLRLKKEYRERIEEDIREGVSRFGHSPEYWDHVRSLALRYWSEWDRSAIFEQEQDSAGFCIF